MLALGQAQLVKNMIMMVATATHWTCAGFYLPLTGIMEFQSNSDNINREALPPGQPVEQLSDSESGRRPVEEKDFRRAEPAGP